MTHPLSRAERGAIRRQRMVCGCGGQKQPNAARCRSCMRVEFAERAMGRAISETSDDPLAMRNTAIVAVYRGTDLTLAEIGILHRLSPAQIRQIVNEAGAIDPERARRNKSKARARAWGRGVYDNVDFGPRRGGYWPDCPPELRDDFRVMRAAGIPAAEARRALDPGEQA